MEADDFKTLLSFFDKEIVFQERDQNFFDVAGYPHYENVVSNILAFFFDTEEEHNLKDLWLKSLIECYIEKSGYQKDIIFDSYSTVEVQREVGTDEKKRIDLLITTNNGLMIVVENKIYHEANNPFIEYHKTAVDLNDKNESGIIEILLTIYNEGDIEKFINITYKDFLSKIRENCGAYISNANEKWLLYMNEFMKNLDNRMDNGMKINKEFQNIIRDNSLEVMRFYEYMKKDIKSKIDFLQKAGDRIEEKTRDKIVAAKKYGDSSLSNSHASHHFDIVKYDEHTIVYEPYFMKIPQIDGDNKNEFTKGGILYLAIWDRMEKGFDEQKAKEIFRNEFANCQVTEIESRKSWGKFMILDQLEFEKIEMEAFIDKSVDIITKIKDKWC